MSEYVMPKDYRQGRACRNEDNDCGVIALAAAADVLYGVAHTILAGFGRKNRKSTHIDWVLKGLEALGVDIVPRSDLRGLTISQLAAQKAHGTFFVVVHKHGLTIRHGNVLDWTTDRSTRQIKRVYEIAD